MLTQQQLHAIMPQLKAARGTALFPFVAAAIAEFEIDTPERTAAFLAQLAHESGQLRFMEEIWGPTAAQRRYEPPSTLATMLGNTETGDGRRFKGRGPIQLTGRANYARFGPLLGIDLTANPESAAEPDVAFRIAGLFWSKRGLNELADLVTAEAFKEITRRINGGFNGLADRERFYEAAKGVLGVTASPTPQGGTLGVDFTDEANFEFDRGWEALREAGATPRRPQKRSAPKARGAKSTKTPRRTSGRAARPKAKRGQRRSPGGSRK